MTLEIRALDLGDRGTVDAIVALQRASYRVEADLLGARTLPALTESPRQLRGSGEDFLGAYEGERLVGAVSWKRSGPLLDIHRMVVAPRPLPPRHRRPPADRARRARAGRRAHRRRDRRGQPARAPPL